jgi:hypothetical protein
LHRAWARNLSHGAMVGFVPALMTV